jgi:hypothetical protein
MRKVLDVIWGAWEQKYFSEEPKKDSTALSTNRPTGKSAGCAVATNQTRLGRELINA